VVFTEACGAQAKKTPLSRGVGRLCVEESLLVIIIWSKAQYPTSHPDCIPDLRFLIPESRGLASFPTFAVEVR
jgi:hypothetical protein